MEWIKVDLQRFIIIRLIKKSFERIKWNRRSEAIANKFAAMGWIRNLVILIIKLLGT